MRVPARAVAAACLLLALAPGTAAEARRRAPMSVAQFLAMHDRLSHSKREMPAAFVYNWSNTLIGAIGEGLDIDRKADAEARAAGRPPLYCVPPKSEFGVRIEYLHQHLLTLPAEQRATTTLRDAVAAYALTVYRCSAA